MLIEIEIKKKKLKKKKSISRLLHGTNPSQHCKPMDDKNLKLRNGYCEINGFNIPMIVSIVLKKAPDF